MSDLKTMAAVTTLPHGRQRYETVGDWEFAPGGMLHVHVSQMEDWRYEALVAVHELVEALLCKARGISEESVTAFDNAQLQWLKEHNIDPTLAEEPGDHPDAPYRREHFFATTIERLLAAELGVDWEEYDKAVNAL